MIVNTKGLILGRRVVVTDAKFKDGDARATTSGEISLPEDLKGTRFDRNDSGA